MKLFRPKYPSILKLLYPGRISRLDNSGAIYLTFDDGPVPEVTPWVLEELKKWNAKASFFCIGENVKKHPAVFKKIIKEGHCIGNHTFNHLNGWKTSVTDYIENTQKAEDIMNQISQVQNSDPELSTPPIPNYKLFRPPYGKIKNSQAKQLVSSGFKIVMWDVISGDYDQDFSAEECYKNVIDNTVGGSTIVLHDSVKASENLKVILPKILKYYSEKGFEFRNLTDAL
ncbi:polysaccharide deacetylase family protein [Christiangramia aquimixticola]|uniref:polysaccharide deacetylase family protein n=1 Tax=Christiangramia aquimixticola TaxID=1697558 RepID=UPI003AA8262A